MNADDPRDSDRADDELGRLLAASAPRVSALTPTIEDELARMSVRAETDVAPARRGRGRRAVVAGLVAAVVLGGAGAAAAAATDTWPWSKVWEVYEPDLAYSYALPSGATCHARLEMAGIARAHHPAREAARDYLDSVDILSVIDVDAEIERIRADERWFVADDGSLVPAGYGTELYPSPDEEYHQAVSRLVSDAVLAEIDRRGFVVDDIAGERAFSIGQEVDCPGMQE